MAGFTIDDIEVTGVTLDGVPVSEFQLDGVLVWPTAVPIQDVFSVDIYTGTGLVGQNITNNIDSITEDSMIWIKCRNSAFNNVLFDTKRGAANFLVSNDTDPESTSSTTLESFNSDGFTVGSNATTGSTTSLYVGWAFRKAPKFFDVIAYTGNGISGTEIPHSLGVQAGFCIVKKLDGAGNWRGLHVDRGIKVFTLDATSQEIDNPSLFPTPMTDTTVTLGDFTDTNLNGYNFIMYVFAHDPSPEGVIQCGEYTGNGVPEGGPLVSLGWQPQYVLIKRSDLTGNWSIFDTTRGTGVFLWANESNAELSDNRIALNSDGFQALTNAGDVNATGGNYIYMAIRGE